MEFTRACIPSANRLLCRAAAGRAAISNTSISKPERMRRGAQGQQLSTYALRTPRQFRSFATQSKGQIFSEEDVPPLDFWRRSARWGTITPEECHEVARIYCEKARFQDQTWRGRLQSDQNIKPETLHSLATMLVSGPPSPLWKLGLHMMSTASELGFAPSTLLLVRLMRQTEDPGKLSSSSLFRNALARLQSLVRQKRDPDALTLKGLILAEEGENGKALALFNQAVQVGSPEQKDLTPRQTASKNNTEATPGARDGVGETTSQPQIRPFRWSWEASCHIGRAKILLQQGLRDDAIAALRIAALELDNPQGYFELGKILPEDAPERAQYLQTAAVSGHVEACRILGEEEVQRAKGSGQSSRKAKEHSLWASEWFSLAGDVEKAAGARWAYSK